MVSFLGNIVHQIHRYLQETRRFVRSASASIEKSATQRNARKCHGQNVRNKSCKRNNKMAAKNNEFFT